MIPFEYRCATRFVIGPNQVDRLGELTREMGAHRALVVSDPGIVAAGHTAHGIRALESAGVRTRLFDGVHENPTTEHVAHGVEVARQFHPDVIVGLGGGSSMDCAKGINFLFTNGGRMQDYWGVGKATQPMLPLVAVPTTSGTGSEAQSFALISDADTHVKMACGDPKAASRVAILDPLLTLTQPTRVTALTGIDAMAHALETYVTKRRNPMSIVFSREAWRLLSDNFARVLEEPRDVEARAAMQLGACLAGMAIENSMLGAAHALANPLTARYGIVHGEAVALMLPHVVRFNGVEYGHWYRELAQSMGNDAVDGPAYLAQCVAVAAEHARLAQRLSDCDVPRGDLQHLAADAARQWTAGFNPRAVGEPELLRLYEAAY